LQQYLKLNLEEMEPILALLSQASLVQQVKTGGWVQIIDPGHVTVADIYRLFAFRPEALRSAAAGSVELERLLENITTGMNEKMNVSLAQLFALKPDNEGHVFA
jgi:membrane protein